MKLAQSYSRLGTETAFEVADVLAKEDLLRSEQGRVSRRWISSGDATRFAAIGSQLLGPELDTVETICWEG